MTEPPRTPDDLRMQAEVRDDALYPRPQPPASEREAALEAAKRVKASAIENGGRLTPGAILDIQTMINFLAAHPTPPPPLPEDLTQAAPLDIYVRGFEDGKAAANFDARLSPAATPSPDAGELERLRTFVEYVANQNPTGSKNADGHDGWGYPVVLDLVQRAQAALAPESGT